MIVEEEEAPKAKKAKATHSWTIFGFLSRMWNRLCGRVHEEDALEHASIPIEQKDIESQAPVSTNSSSSLTTPTPTTTANTELIPKTKSIAPTLDPKYRLRADVSTFSVIGVP